MVMLELKLPKRQPQQKLLLRTIINNNIVNSDENTGLTKTMQLLLFYLVICSREKYVV